jgi:glycosyltransferase involved in cell wall biosynthesis
MAAGLPCVVTAIPGNVDLVQDHMTGRLVSPGDTSSLSEGISSCLTDSQRAGAYARAGLALVESAHDEVRERGEWQALLKELTRA